MPSLPSPSDFLGQPVPGRPYVIAEFLGKGANALVFRARSEAMRRDVACKIIPRANLRVGTSPETGWEREIQAANTLPSRRVVKIFDMGDWNSEHIFLLADLVNGESLRSYIKRKKTIEVPFIVDLIQNLLDFLRELGSEKIVHGDLHDGNILVEDCSSALIGRPQDFRITDFGVAPFVSGANLLDDFDEVAKIVRTLLEHVNFQQCGATERLIFQFLRDDMLSKSLHERDATYSAASRDPVALYRHLERGLQTAQKRGSSSTSSVTTLVTPFEFLSCEQLGDAHKLLKDLYSDKMLGLPTIEERTNLILTGPRGCGKTTVLRCISLKHRVLTNDAAPDSLKYLGVYYRCDDLYFAFPQYKHHEREGTPNIPMHFVCATLLRELCESVLIWAQTSNFPSFKKEEEQCARSLWRLLGLQPPAIPNTNTLSAIINKLDKERERAAKKQRCVGDNTHPMEHLWGPDILLDACRNVREHFSFIESRPIYFLVDDYSSPRITPALQRNLNRLFMQRSSDCFFKLATESPASYESIDLDGKAYVEGREFRLTNLGINFINAPLKDRLRFVDDVFERRFKYATDFPVRDLKRLIGDPPNKTHNQMAVEIRAGQKPIVGGRRALAEICSGDVHSILELVGSMVNSAGGVDNLKPTGNAKPAISYETQSASIRKEAGLFLARLKLLPDGRGRRLVEVVEAFGNVAHSYLYYRSWPNGSAHQASRIDRYEDPELLGDSREVYADLLRYSVFIEDSRGRSRRGSTVPRLYLRRFLIPFFNLTFTKKDTIELSNSDFYSLLVTPSSFVKKKQMTQPKTVAPETGLDDTQLRLQLPKPEAK